MAEQEVLPQTTTQNTSGTDSSGKCSNSTTEGAPITVEGTTTEAPLQTGPTIAFSTPTPSEAPTQADLPSQEIRRSSTTLMKSSRTELDVYLAELGLEVGGKVLELDSGQHMKIGP